MSVMLVTGGAGFIGSHIAERLVELGHRVRIIDNFSTGRRENVAPFADRIELIEADVRDLDAVRAAVEGVEVVFHEAALASVPRSVDDPATSNEVNVVGTLNVLVAGRDAGVRRVVYASSIRAVDGYPLDVQVHTSSSVRPMTLYGVSKCFGEALGHYFAHAEALPCIAVRVGTWEGNWEWEGDRINTHTQKLAQVSL